MTNQDQLQEIIYKIETALKWPVDPSARKGLTEAIRIARMSLNDFSRYASGRE